MRNAYYARDNFDVRRGGRGFSCAVKKQAHIAERCSWHTHFPSKTEYPQSALHAGKKWRPTLESPLYIYGQNIVFCLT